jgi:arginyl-tRNA synthetase
MLLSKNKMIDVQQKLKTLIQEALSELSLETENIVLEHPADVKNGDYATSVALALSKKAGMNPRELGQRIADLILRKKDPLIATVSVAGPGFINFTIVPSFFIETTKTIGEAGVTWGHNKKFAGKKVMVEYTDPNPFKPFHIGHLMTNAIGESLARIFEFSSAITVRANYQGDVGQHVAKAIYGLQKNRMPEGITTSAKQSEYIGSCYVKGSEAYENDPEAKKEIDRINKAVYEKSDGDINKLYDWGRKVTLEAFEELYTLLGTKFNHYFFESEMAAIGSTIVKANIGPVFEESDGAIVFKGEKYDPALHTRVFINSAGLPTYETKEIGLTKTKFEKEPGIEKSIVITAIEQGEYMKVVTKAISLLYPEIAPRMQHITHGMMRWANGKMSSRKGNVVTGESLIRDSYEIIFEKIKDREFDEETRKHVAEAVGIGAIKYSILRQAIGGDIIYDMEKSFSFEGDSGPYLQYATVRAKSILEKAKAAGISEIATTVVDWETTALERYLYRFPEIVERALQELEPHHIATYLIELSSLFNAFYANHQIIKEGDSLSSYRVALTKAFATTMENGLTLLGIRVPTKM